MKEIEYSLGMLRATTSQVWVDTVLNDFDSFLQDHADCERKASAMAMSFVAKYPDRVEIIPELIDTAVEEMHHFRQVYKIMEKRGVTLAKEINKDLYINQLVDLCRSSSLERFMDRLILASMIEWRSCERFKLVAENLSDQELKNLYHNLWESEGRHGEVFIQMALTYFPQADVNERLDYFLDQEAKILNALVLRAALH
jgi:tRNA-(ms[2]io[6]A)-hydroxylase